MLNEPLEEIMGKLLEVNPSAATQLLESRGLAIMPMDLVDPLLHQAEQKEDWKEKEKWTFGLEMLTSDLEKLMSDFERQTSDMEKLSSDLEKLTSDLEKMASDEEKLSSGLEKTKKTKENQLGMTEK
ncbi:hypothetical protein U1Q18_012035 [Sarracenia purpurea var. burkii]